MGRNKLIDTADVWVKTQIEGMSRKDYAKKERITKQAVDYHIQKMKRVLEMTKGVKND